MLLPERVTIGDVQKVFRLMGGSGAVGDGVSTRRGRFEGYRGGSIGCWGVGFGFRSGDLGCWVTDGGRSTGCSSVEGKVGVWPRR